MSSDAVPPDVQEFIFEYIDSIDQLEVMLLLRTRPERYWSAQDVSNEMRTNPESAANRLARLKALGILRDNGTLPPSYRYCPTTPELDKVVSDLAEACKVRRHKVYELIFSSLKRARKFLNAFTMPNRREDGDD